MIVADTNLIAYSVISSNFTADAVRVFEGDSDWAAPRLWKSEMRSVLSIYLRRKEMTLDEANTAMKKAELIIGGHTYDVYSDRVLELAYSSGCTAYDCEFVSLAERLNVPLVTSDKKVLAAFPEIAVSIDAFATRNLLP